MTSVNNALSVWIQLANLFFTLSGFFTDLLMIRLSLSSAYFFLLLNSILGGPLWPDLSRAGAVSVDALVWSAFNFTINTVAVIRLFLDEAPVVLNQQDQAQSALWRMLYRHGGLSARIFKDVLVHKFDVVSYEPGESIPVDNYFYIVYEGRIKVDIYAAGASSSDRGNENNGKSIVCRTRILESADVFDFKHLDLFHPSARSVFAHRVLDARSDTAVKLFRFQSSDIAKIANSPVTKGIWQSILICSLSQIAKYSNDNAAATASSGTDSTLTSSESSDVTENDISHPLRDPVFGPLQKWEEPNPVHAGSGMALSVPLGHLLHYASTSFLLPWPLTKWKVGLRQGSLPAPQWDKF